MERQEASLLLHDYKTQEKLGWGDGLKLKPRRWKEEEKGAWVNQHLHWYHGKNPVFFLAYIVTMVISHSNHGNPPF